MHLERLEGADGPKYAVQVGPDALHVLFGFQRVGQGQHIEAAAAHIQKKAVVYLAGIDGPRRMREDEVQRFFPVPGRANGLDEVVACTGGSNAQRGVCMHQPGCGLADRSVSTHGDHRFHPAVGGVPRQLRGVSRIFRVANDEIYLLLL